MAGRPVSERLKALAALGAPHLAAWHHPAWYTVTVMERSSDVHLVRAPAVIPIPEQGAPQTPPAQPSERV